MSTWFAWDPVVVALVMLAMLAAMGLALRRPHRLRWWIALLQIPCAGLLLAALLLRDDTNAAALVVLTADADAQAVEQSAGQGPLVALPGAPVTGDAEQFPDLATALRRYPAATQVHVIGAGLDEHDREALGERDMRFTPPPEDAEITTAIVELDAPATVRAGAWWPVRGRVTNPSNRTIELRDPAGEVLATTSPDEHGAFVLHGLSRATGPVLFALRVLDGDHVLQSMPLPVLAQDGATVRALLLAAAPSPELKFLRRWALDAGIDLTSRIALSPGIAQRRGAPAIDDATLAQLDLLIVDERSWSQLATQQDALRAAIRDGLGLLVRITGPVPERTLRDWKELGIAPVFAAPKPRAVRLEVAGAPGKDGDDLHAWPVTLDGDGNVALLRDSDGTPLASRRLFGRGRIGVWWLSDSYRLATRSAREAFATLWADTVASIARARGVSAPALPRRAVVGQRAVLCAAAGAMQVLAPEDETIPLLRDPSQGDCAAFWPTQPGWHRLLHEASDNEQGNGMSPQSFYVFAPEDIDALRRRDIRQATAALVNGEEIPVTRAPDRDLLRAGLLVLWLAVAALLWRLERIARGRADPGERRDPASRPSF